MKVLAQKSLVFSLLAVSVCLVNCSKPNSTEGLSEDTSASGAAAGAVGGALSSSNSNGAQAQIRIDFKPTLFASVKSAINPLPQAMADSVCPTFRSTDSDCSASGSSMWLNYNSCSFKDAVSWNGAQAISMSSGSAACGTFPNPGANGTLYRQFVQSAGSSSPGELTLSFGAESATVDDASANLSNFDGDSLATIHNGGYGAAVSFNSSGARSSLDLGHHISVTGRYDHTVTGNLTVTETAGASSRTISGSIKVYHNLLRVIGTSTFNDVLHSDTCCLPVSGSITTAFSAGNTVNPTILGRLAVGKSETLTFTGCGSATLQSYDGTVSNVSLNRCF